jgi:hypothetical protein
MNIFDNPTTYRAFLITCWQERSQDPQVPAVWRFSLEDPRDGTRRGFATLEAVMLALEQKINQAGWNEKAA